MPISDNDYKSQVVKLIAQDENAPLSLLAIPNKKVAIAVFEFKLLVNDLVRLAEVDHAEDADVVNLEDIYASAPNPELFSTREDYLKAKEIHEKIKRLLSIIGRKKVYVSVSDLEQILNYVDAFDAYLNALSSIKGSRLKVLMTHREKISMASDRNRKMLSLLHKDDD